MNNIYIDIDRAEAVKDRYSNSEAALPPFTQGDTLEEVRIWLMKDFTVENYTLIPVAGITLEVALGLKQGTAAAYYTQQFTWTPSTDLLQPYFSGTIPMNTAGIDSLLGTREKAAAWLEVKKIENALPKTVLSRRVIVQASVIKPDNIIALPGLTPLYVESANVTYLRRTIRGRIRVESENGLFARELYVDDTDGSWRSEPIT